MKRPAWDQWLLVGLFFSLTLLTFRKAYDYTLIRLAAANLFLLAGAVWLISRGAPRKLPASLLWLLAGLLSAAAASFCFSWFPPAGLRAMTRLLTGLGLFLVGSQLRLSSVSLAGWFSAVVILGFYAFFEHLTQSRIVTPLGNKNFFAGYLVLVVPVFLAWGLSRFRSARTGIGAAGEKQADNPNAGFQQAVRLSAVAIIAGVAFLLVMLRRAQSASAWLGLFSGTAVILAVYLYQRLCRKGRRALFLICLALGFLAGGLSGLYRGVPQVRDNVRAAIWEGTIGMVRARPLTGFGPGSFLPVFQQFRPAAYYTHAVAAPVTDHAHNEYLELAAEYGLPALALFLAFWAIFFRHTFRGWRRLHAARAPESFLLAGLLAGIIGILADGLFSTNLRTHTVAPAWWLSAGLAFSLADLPGRFASTTETGGPVAVFSSGKPSFLKDRAGLLLAGCLVVTALFSLALLTREISGQVYYKRGILMREENRMAAAAKYYRQALRREPANLFAAYRLGFVYANSGQVQQAIQTYRDLLVISPNFARTYYNLGLIYYHQEQFAAAAYYLEQALRYNPGDRDSLKLRATLRDAMGGEAGG